MSDRKKDVDGLLRAKAAREGKTETEVLREMFDALAGEQGGAEAGDLLRLRDEERLAGILEGMAAGRIHVLDVSGGFGRDYDFIERFLKKWKGRVFGGHVLVRNETVPALPFWEMEERNENLRERAGRVCAGTGAATRKWPAVCVDLESLGTTSGAVLLEIGAVCFDPETGEFGPEFEFEVDARAQDFRNADVETLLWWADRRAEGVEMPGVEAHDGELWAGLRCFADFMEAHTRSGEVELWAWGVDFDCGILKDAWRPMLGETQLPWIYPNQRDARTFCKKLGVEREGKIAHRALADARQEARAVMAANSKLKTLNSREEEEEPRIDADGRGSGEGENIRTIRPYADIHRLLRQVNQLLRRTESRPAGLAFDPLKQKAESVVKDLLGMIQKEYARQKDPAPPCDMEAGWDAYRRELLETVGMTHLPGWEALPEQVKESWCVGVRAALKL